MTGPVFYTATYAQKIASNLNVLERYYDILEHTVTENNLMEAMPDI